MTVKEIMRQYFMGEMDAISVIRLFSGMFDPKNASHLLSLICTITRHEQGDIDTNTFNDVWKFGIDLEFNKGDYPQEYDDMPMKALREELAKLEDRKNQATDEIRTKGPSLDRETDHLALDHDFSLLVSYLMFRERKNKKEEAPDD